VNCLASYLFVAAALFSLGLLGVLQRRNLIAMLISIELMLNGANINFVAFSRFLAPEPAVDRSSLCLLWYCRCEPPLV
jgi:NADH-quinone oxidoreductase subunit K/NAD(P)H-quinone oxidoreductase subunit 4L